MFDDPLSRERLAQPALIRKTLPIIDTRCFLVRRGQHDGCVYAYPAELMN